MPILHSEWTYLDLPAPEMPEPWVNMLLTVDTDTQYAYWTVRCRNGHSGPWEVLAQDDIDLSNELKPNHYEQWLAVSQLDDPGTWLAQTLLEAQYWVDDSELVNGPLDIDVDYVLEWRFAATERAGAESVRDDIAQLIGKYAQIAPQELDLRLVESGAEAEGEG